MKCKQFGKWSKLFRWFVEFEGVIHFLLKSLTLFPSIGLFILGSDFHVRERECNLFAFSFKAKRLYSQLRRIIYFKVLYFYMYRELGSLSSQGFRLWTS